MGESLLIASYFFQKSLQLWELWLQADCGL